MKIAIQANPSRGEEIISLLESLGGINEGYEGDGDGGAYYIDENNIIRYNYRSIDYKAYTLEEFEKEFPFKIGDKVKYCSDNEIGTIIDFIDIDDELMYLVDFDHSGITCMPTKYLKPYKEMKEERNITLTLDKAKEWYKKGGELKEVALQAYSEEELIKVELPKTWEEFCINYPKTGKESYIGIHSAIHQFTGTNHDRDNYSDKNICPSKESAKAHLAMIQLEQLRDCWRQGWKPSIRDTGVSIKYAQHGLAVYRFCSTEFLSFPTEKMAEEFLDCFKDLIEKAGDLI